MSILRKLLQKRAPSLSKVSGKPKTSGQLISELTGYLGVSRRLVQPSRETSRQTPDPKAFELTEDGRVVQVGSETVTSPPRGADCGHFPSLRVRDGGFPVFGRRP